MQRSGELYAGIAQEDENREAYQLALQNMQRGEEDGWKEHGGKRFAMEKMVD